MWGGCLGFGSPQLKAAGTCPPRTRDDAPKRMVRSADTPDGHLPTEPAACERQGPEQEPPCTNAIRASPIAHLDGQAPSSGQMASLRKRSIPRPRRHTPAGRRLPAPALWQPSSASASTRAIHLVGSQSRARCGDLPSGTGSRLGTSVGVGYRAGALVSTHPVNRSQLDRHLELAARSRTIAAPIGARFGHGPETAISCGDQARRERNQWTNRKISPGSPLAVHARYPGFAYGVGPMVRRLAPSFAPVFSTQTTSHHMLASPHRSSTCAGNLLDLPAQWPIC